jgi:hypothetical protein
VFFHSSENANSLNSIKDMLAGLPQFQEGKEAYSLHLSMAQDCMNIFQQRKLADVASVEQVRAISTQCGNTSVADAFSHWLPGWMKTTANQRI